VRGGANSRSANHAFQGDPTENTLYSRVVKELAAMTSVIIPTVLAACFKTVKIAEPP
jgi:hypothetical protein